MEGEIVMGEFERAFVSEVKKPSFWIAVVGGIVFVIIVLGALAL